MELGIYTFAERTADPNTGIKISATERMKNLLEEVQLAEATGLDVFAIGEHHRPDFVVSSPAVVLGAAAALTKRIKLSSAVTVLSSDDPVRVFQDFATLDLLSDGRAEIMAGRGSFIESFPLFGYDLADYDALFAEKLDLLLQINASEIIDWKGKFRSPIQHQGVYPRPMQEKLPVWIAVGGTPASVIRAGKLGLPLAIAIIGGSPKQFVPLVKLYRDTWAAAGHPPEQLQLSINSHGFIADTSQLAADQSYPSFADVMTQLGRERGWQPMTRPQFEQMRSPIGALLTGSPQEVIDKILLEHEWFGNTRFLLQMSVGSLPHHQLLRSIELFGTVVAPAVRKALAGKH